MPNGVGFMPPKPAPSFSWDDEPPEWEDEFEGAEFWDTGEIEAIVAESDRAAADEAAVVEHIASLGVTAAMGAASSARRGPGQPGSARLIPGVCDGPGGGFATGQVLDVAPGGGGLLIGVEKAAGDDGRFGGTSDDELMGILAAADRSEASGSALKHAAAAELIRRRPGKAPGAWAEFTDQELASVLAESRHAAETILDLASDLDAKLPGTSDLFGAGLITRHKAQIIATACRPLDADEARAAEAVVLGRAPGLTPGGLRYAIAHAVIEVNAEKAKQRREAARQHARVEVYPEFSGNAALEARELPMAEAAAMDQRISWWAGQLKASGVEGTHDQLRARALVDLVLSRDSRPGHAGESLAAVPAGFAGHLNLTIPAATLLDLADRPGEITTMGPIDPWLARDLATAAAQNSKTTWCVTVTDKDGHAVAHGCARPDPNARRKRGQHPPGRPPPRGPSPPGGTGPPTGTGFTLTPDPRAGPPGTRVGPPGTWRLRAPGPGPDLIVDLEPLTTDPCDHRHETAAHDPGTRLRHLTQIRYSTCTAPGCRRPASGCDYEHTTPHEAGGRTCLCNGNPKCRYHHRLKQHPKWRVGQQPDGTLRWTTPSGRSYTTEPTRYPI
jgi:Domain of unknown function (DUF222)